jgi:hypothetical protein
MVLTESALPTAWLAPPEGLLPSNHITKIEPVPIAISAVIALVVGALAIVLFNRRGKDMFIEDHIVNTAEDDVPEAVIAHSGIRSEYPAAIADQIDDVRKRHPEPVNAPQTPSPALLQEHHTGRQPSFGYQPKLDAVLGWKDDWEPGRNRTQLSPIERRAYYASARARYDEYEHDRDISVDYEKNSAYLPLPRSAASGDESMEWADRSLMFGRDPDKRRSVLSLASKTRLGDAY